MSLTVSLLIPFVVIILSLFIIELRNFFLANEIFNLLLAYTLV